MAQSLDALIKQGEADQDAVEVGDGIFMSKNIANSYLVTSAEGDVLINTGTDFEAPAIKARFARVSNAPLRVITFTQGHPDHVGGWDLFNAVNGSCRRSPRPTTATCANTGAACTRSTAGASWRSGVRSWMSTRWR